MDLEFAINVYTYLYLFLRMNIKNKIIDIKSQKNTKKLDFALCMAVEVWIYSFVNFSKDTDFF